MSRSSDGGYVSASLSTEQAEARGMIDSERRRRWYAYYTEKRIVHQWFQVKLLEPLGVQSVLEIGPNLGLVTAMLANAGFRVTTLDLVPEATATAAVGHIQTDLLEASPEQLRGFDAILCCEVLEHLPWERAGDVLETFATSGAPWLILSVPYEGPQLGLSLYINAHRFRKRSFAKWNRFLRRFVPGDLASIDAHKWEIGYRGYSLRALHELVERHGWSVHGRDFTAECRSVFLVCRNRLVEQGAPT